MVVPSEFQPVSRIISESHRKGLLEAEEVQMLSGVSVMLVFCDVHDREEMQLAVSLSTCVAQRMGNESPPTILVPHRSNPELQDRDADEEFAAFAEAMGHGIDGVIFGEPEGMRLAGEVQSAIMGQAKLMNAYNMSSVRHDEKTQHMKEVKDSVHDIVWQYLRQRLQLYQIPPPDFVLSPCQPGVVLDNFKIGAQVGQGAHGAVYKLESNPMGPMVRWGRL